MLAGTAAGALLAAGGVLHATRPKPPPEAPPPYPSQAVDVGYLGPAPAGTPGGDGFRFLLSLTALTGPPITVTRISQPYAGLSLTAIPRPPFRTRTGIPHKIVITLHVTECGKVPRNAGLPFLDVTLRNVRAMQTHSFILGTPYARDLSEALQVACSNEFATSPKR